MRRKGLQSGAVPFPPLETGEQSKMSDISSADYRDLFALITVVCYMALVTSGLIAILDRSHKSHESVSRERETAKAKRSISRP